ncbi:MAG: aldose 1-epimerase family protein [Roseiarcus sp.]|jgi:hypothetical protein
MTSGPGQASIDLRRGFFGEKERKILGFRGLGASLFRYDTGVEAIRLSNDRGHIVILPYMGQIVWSAAFDGVELAMQSMFKAPRPAKVIVETYGCLVYHAGLLRNGVPTAQDNHALHGEMPCAEMDGAGLECGADERGPWIAVTGLREYAMGFGAHYRAAPRVVLRPDATDFVVVMAVENLSAAPMDLMYLCHVNFAFAEGARIVQPVPFTPGHVVTRTAIPGHVAPTDDYRALLEELAANPARMETLAEPERYDPEQVFYIKGLPRGPDGHVHFMLARREGDGFVISWDPEIMPHTIRWILANGDQRVAAFAMPATCEPEGYLAEKRKGHVRSLAGHAKAAFATHIGYVDAGRAVAAARRIEGAPR